MAEDSVTLDGGKDNLDDDLCAGSSDTESVFLGLILVLILLNKSSSGLVVGLSLSSSSVLDLESGEVRSCLDGLDECHV